jgi:hypothetical protein
MRDWANFGHHVPELRGFLAFGAADGFVLAGVNVSTAKLISVALGAIAFAILFVVDPLRDWKIDPSWRAAWLSFVLGAVLLTGCFFAGTSFLYRWVYGIWLLPLIWRLLTDHSTPKRVRRLAATAAASLLLLLWLNGLLVGLLLRYGQGFGYPANDISDHILAAEQPVLWLFFLCLLAFLAHFTRANLVRVWSFSRPPKMETANGVSALAGKTLAE